MKKHPCAILCKFAFFLQFQPAKQIAVQTSFAFSLKKQQLEGKPKKHVQSSWPKSSHQHLYLRFRPPGPRMLGNVGNLKGLDESQKNNKKCNSSSWWWRASILGFWGAPTSYKWSFNPYISRVKSPQLHIYFRPFIGKYKLQTHL